jgi:hypothetical protein
MGTHGCDRARTAKHGFHIADGRTQRRFDEATAERFAYYLRLPTPIFWLLLGMTLLVTSKKVHVLVAFLSIMWTIVIVDILDLASPRVGNFRASPAVYDWTLQGFKGGLQIPPKPGAK